MEFLILKNPLNIINAALCNLLNTEFTNLSFYDTTDYTNPYIVLLYGFIAFLCSNLFQNVPLTTRTFLHEKINVDRIYVLLVLVLSVIPVRDFDIVSTFR